jgi:radical SAM protein with 4Fe4S-binding SPASM domain
MCPITIPSAREKYITDERMSWETYQKIILEAEKYECPSLNPQGLNEPLLDQDFESYVKFAKNHGFLDVMINSNATLLSEERSRKILGSGLTRLRFSLDAATKETYEKIRVGAKYDSVMKNIKRFIKIRDQEGFKLPIVGVNFVKMKINEHEINEFIEKWRDEVDFIALQEFVPPESDSDYSEFFTSDLTFQNQVTNSFNCQQPWQRLNIHNNGDVAPCCTTFGSELALGNVSNQSLYEMWNSEEMNNLRKIHKEGRYMDNPWCNKCVKSMSGNANPSDLLQIRKISAPK